MQRLCKKNPSLVSPFVRAFFGERGEIEVSRESADLRGEAGAPEVEVTAPMIEAGLPYLYELPR